MKRPTRRTAPSRSRSQPVASGLAFPLYLTAPDGRSPALHRREGRDHPDREGRRAAADSLPRHLGTGFHRQRAGTAGPGLPPRSTPRTGGSSSTTPTSPATPGCPASGSPAIPTLADAASEVAILSGGPAVPQSQRRPGAVRPRRLSLRHAGRRRVGGRSGRPGPVARRSARLHPAESSRSTPAATRSRPTIRSSAPPAPVPEIWSYGLRNPWRVAFDPATGDLYIADVGTAPVGGGQRLDSRPTARAGDSTSAGGSWRVRTASRGLLRAGRPRASGALVRPRRRVLHHRRLRLSRRGDPRAPGALLLLRLLPRLGPQLPAWSSGTRDGPVPVANPGAGRRRAQLRPRRRRRALRHERRRLVFKIVPG